MNKLYYFVGAFMPIPLFFDLNSLSFLFHKMSFDGSGYLTSYGKAVPFSLFVFSAITLFLFSSLKENKYSISREVLIPIFLLILFSILSIFQIGIMRLLMLLFPFVCMLFAVSLVRNNRAYVEISTGYIVSFLLFILLHFFSVIYYSLNGVEDSINGDSFLFNSVFSILIYQALVSYSAVLSYVAGTLFFFALYKSKFSQKVLIYIFIIIILFLLSLGARKAVLLDAGIIFALLFFSSIFTLKIKKYILIFPISAIIGYLLLPYTSFYNRVISLDHVLEHRSGAYSVFFDSMTNANLTTLLLGHEGSGAWGGFSNIFLEIMYRLGILGFLLYFIAFLAGIVIVRVHFKYLFNFDKCNNYLSLWLWFTVLTVLFSNIFNMNLQLPYYSMNITMIILVFLHQTQNLCVHK